MRILIVLGMLLLLASSAGAAENANGKGKRAFGLTGSLSYFSGEGSSSNYIKNAYVDGFGIIHVKERDNYRAKPYAGLTLWYNPFRHSDNEKWDSIPAVLAITFGLNEATGSNGTSYLFAFGAGAVFGDNDDTLFTIQYGWVRDKVETMQYPFLKNSLYPGNVAETSGTPEAFQNNALLIVPTESIYGKFTGLTVTVSKSLNLSGSDSSSGSSATGDTGSAR